MCGHFKAVPRNVVELIIRDIEIGNHTNVLPDWPARSADAYPGSFAPLIVPTIGGLEAVELKWGYSIPGKTGLAFNARSETALSEAGMWRDSLLNRRCIVPSFGFFEPHRTELSVSERTGRKIKRQYRFDGPRPLLFMAGVYRNDRFSILTTAPNAAVEPVHDRMPVVLLEHELSLWLSPDYQVLFDREGIELSAIPLGTDAAEPPEKPNGTAVLGQQTLW